MGQRHLEVLDAVRGEDEGHVRVGVEPVEGVEHLEQQGRGAHREGSVLGDEVAVLEDDDRRLVRSRDLCRVVDEPERAPAQQHGRHPGRRREQVADRVRLAGTGWPVEQDASLEVLPLGAKALALHAHPHDVVRDARQQAVRQHDCVGIDGRPLHEGDPHQAGAVRVAAEGHDLAAQDAPLVHERVDPRHERVREVAVRGHHLDAPRLPAELAVHALLAHRHGAPLEAEETDARGHHLPPVALARSGRHAVVVDLSHR